MNMANTANQYTEHRYLFAWIAQEYKYGKEHEAIFDKLNWCTIYKYFTEKSIIYMPL